MGSIRFECAAAVGLALGLAAACGDDSVVRKKPIAASDAGPGDGQAGASSGGGGSNAGGASAGGKSSAGGVTSTGGASAHTPCTNSLACGSNQVCDKVAGYCVECVVDSDCTTAGLRCVGQHCRPPCASDKQCTPQGLLCNTPLGVCTECVTDAECGVTETCQVGSCVGSTLGGTGGATGDGGLPSSGGAGGASNGGAGGASNGGAGGASNGGASNGGAGGVSNGGAGGASGAGGTRPTCNRADLWMAVDESGSMTTAQDTGTRWDIVRGGIEGFVTTATRAAAGIVMFPKSGTTTATSCCADTDCPSGLACTGAVFLSTICYVPGTCGGSCSLSAYDTVDVPLTALPVGSTNVFSTFLASVAPTGSSTLAPALERMRVRAVASANANPSNATAMVLVTDGAPGGCTTGNTVPDVANVAATALAGSPSIKTYVITVGIDPSTMASVATAGGTTIFGTSTTVTLAQAVNYVETSLGQIAVDACR